MPQTKSVTKKSTTKKTVPKKSVAKKKVVKKVKAASTSETTPEPTPVAAPVVEKSVAAPVESTESSAPTNTLTQALDQVLTNLTGMVKVVRDLSTAVRRLRTVADQRVRRAERSARAANKRANQRRTRSSNTTPQQLSDALADFLEVEHGTTMSLKDVCAHLTKYFNEHSLHNSENKTHLDLDEPLQALFAPQDGTVVSTRNYRRFVTPHLVSA